MGFSLTYASQYRWGATQEEIGEVAGTPPAGLSKGTTRARREAPHRSSWKESLEVGFCTYGLYRKISFWIFLLMYYRAKGPSHSENRLRIRSEIEAWGQTSVRVGSPSHPPLPSPDRPAAFSLSPGTQSRCCWGFHSENSEVCVYLPHPVYQISTVLIQGKIYNKKWKSP